MSLITHPTPQSEQRFDKKTIEKLLGELQFYFKTDEVFGMGRAAEVIRGVFPTSHNLQFYLDDRNAKQTLILTENAEQVFIDRRKKYNYDRMSRDVKAGAFHHYFVLGSCLIFPYTAHPLARLDEFTRHLRDDSIVNEQTAVRIPSFFLNYAFCHTNPPRHEKTLKMMDAIFKVMKNPIAKIEDIPLVVAIETYLLKPHDKHRKGHLIDLRRRIENHPRSKFYKNFYRDQLKTEETL